MSAPRDRKPYRTPRLVHYGRVQAVTTGFSGLFSDGISAMFRKEMTPKMTK